MRSTLLLPLLLLLGCVDTEFIDDPANPVPPRVEVNASDTALLVGATMQLTAQYFDETGEAVPSAAITWTTSDPTVAGVDADGLVTGLAAGTADLRAEASGTQSRALSLVVVADASAPAHVTVTPASVELQPGQSLAFDATVTNVDGAPLSDFEVAWSTDEPEVATVDADGRVTAVASGVASITASVGEVRSAPAVVTVPGQSRSGSFAPAPGSGYNVQGTATLNRQPDGSLLLTLESDFVTDLGPAMAVYLSDEAGVNGMSTRAGGLTSGMGPQSFTVPNVSLDRYDYVVVQCVPFNITFGSALLN